MISVIVPVYFDTERLGRCLAALSQQTYPHHEFEVIIINNAPSESMVALRGAYPGIRFAEEETPGSYAARNKGLQLAQGDLVAFTDSDCEPLPDWLERGVSSLESDERLGLVAGKVDLFLKDPLRPRPAELLDLLFGWDQVGFLNDLHFGVTANLFTRRSVIERIGPFDASLKSGGDMEWGQRVYAAGFGLRYETRARVKHPALGTTAELVRKVARVTGGLSDLQRRGPVTLLAILSCIGQDARTAVRRTSTVLRSPHVPGMLWRLRLSGLILFLLFIRILERLRIAAGGTSRRA